MSAYFKDLNDSVVSTLKGMSVTLKHLFSKPVTVQYPDEALPISDAYRGKHKLVQDACRACNLCVKACPVECIDIDSERHMKRVIELKKFTIDYNKCIFCGLCVDACPSDSILMTREYTMIRGEVPEGDAARGCTDRSKLIIDICEWHGLRPKDHETIAELKKKAEEDKKKKAEAAAAAKEKGEGGEGAADKPAKAAKAGKKGKKGKKNGSDKPAADGDKGKKE